MLSSALAAQISLAEYDAAAVEGAEVFAVEVASKGPPPSSLSCVVAAAAADASFRGLPVFWESGVKPPFSSPPPPPTDSGIAAELLGSCNAQHLRFTTTPNSWQFRTNLPFSCSSCLVCCFTSRPHRSLPNRTVDCCCCCCREDLHAARWKLSDLDPRSKEGGAQEAPCVVVRLLLPVALHIISCAIQH